MNHDVAPVVAAQALLAHGLDDEAVLTYVRRTWKLDPHDAQAAIAAARVILRSEERAAASKGNGPARKKKPQPIATEQPIATDG